MNTPLSVNPTPAGPKGSTTWHFSASSILFAKQARKVYGTNWPAFPPGSWKKRCCTCCKRSFQHFTSTQTLAKVAANADMRNAGVPYSALLCETLAASKYYIVLRSKNYHPNKLPIHFLFSWTHAVANLGVCIYVYIYMCVCIYSIHIMYILLFACGFATGTSRITPYIDSQ